MPSNLKYILVSAACLLLLSGCGRSDLKRVTVKVHTNILNDTSTVYVSGNNKAFGNWNPSYVKLNRDSADLWSKTFYFPKGEKIEYDFTRGSFSKEAIGPKGLLYNFHVIITVNNDTTVTTFVNGWRDKYDSPVVLTKSDLDNNDGVFILYGWKYHGGDTLAWADPNYNDNNWEISSSFLNPGDYPLSGWNGIGWYRLRLNIDSALLQQSLMFTLLQAGASQVYLDGKLINKFGKVGNHKDEEILFEDRNPSPLVFNKNQTHLIAIRYSDHSAGYFNDKGIYGGFEFIIGYTKNLVKLRLNSVKDSLYNIAIFGSIPFVLALLHFVIFGYYPRYKENIYYAMYMVGFTGLVLSGHLGAFTTNVFQIVTLNKLGLMSENIAIVFGLLTSYSGVYKKIPRHGWVLITIGFVLFLWSSVGYTRQSIVQDIFLSIVILEMLRCIFFVKQRPKIPKVLLFGILFLLASVIYSLLIGYCFITPIYGFTNSIVFGVMVLSITMSVRLSKNFADTYKQLEMQLQQVKELSEQALENERKVKEQEIDRRLLEADNKRKTIELEEARKLQLSMLPKIIPKSANWEIDVFMRTATEVGGDYYDFHTHNNGSLTIAVGDATGHGLNAGTMVAVTKSLFNELAENENIIEIFNKYTTFIKSMNLGNLYMAMTIAKIKDGRMNISSAGMPPVLIYRAKTKKVDKVVLKGMPLGGFLNYPYEQIEIELGLNDIVLFMSDGLPEMFNMSDETFGYEKTMDEFERAGIDGDLITCHAGKEIIDSLLSKAESWADGRIQEDDITFVILKNLYSRLNE